MAKKAASGKDSKTAASLKGIFDLQKADSLDKGPPSYEERMEALETLANMFKAESEAIVDAMVRDFGSRSPHETLIAEVFTTVSGIRHIQKHLKSWMEPEKRPVNWVFLPARARVMVQPKGVVGIISPWNYPFYLAMLPVATALAAGNRVLLKPSEITPITAELMADQARRAFDPSQFTVVNGGPEVGAAFSALPFDHLFFTGSTALGKIIMKAAAENLTPVTLELGGKSPALVCPSAIPSRAADHVAAGRFFNAGQTCVAPDYALVPEGARDRFVRALEKRLSRFYPTLKDNPDYTAVVNENHYNRVLGLIRDAEEKGARIVRVNPANETFGPETRKIPPTLVLDPTEDMAAMDEEIFGPVLPVISYKTLEQAIAFINNKPRPLALYVFGENDREVDSVLERTTSGGAAVNEVMLQVAQDDLPFGGIGASGMGAYHGKEGFDTFSHKKAVFLQPKINAQFLLRPPYTDTLMKFIRFLIR